MIKKILIVANNKPGYFAPFVVEQVDSLKNIGLEIEYFGINGNGIKGYLSHRSLLQDKIISFKPDVIHAHFGLSGLLANLQRKVPVITTFHGCDIHRKKNLVFSKLAMNLSKYNIYVSKELFDSVKFKQKSSIIPCGVDLETFHTISRSTARKKMGLDLDSKYVLFSSNFDIPVKNSSLALASVALCKEVKLIELKGYSRDQVNLLMNAVNCVLMTSNAEGSPQFIKEAMSVNCPIVSVDVGDVKKNIQDVDHCYIVERDSKVIAEKLTLLCEGQYKSNGRTIVEQHYDNKVIAQQLVEIYNSIV